LSDRYYRFRSGERTYLRQCESETHKHLPTK
jgi:hypothetical protein